MEDTVLVKFAGIAKEFSVSKTLDLGFTTVRWYGVIIAFGFLLAVLFGGRIAYKWKINLDKMVDVLLYGTIGGIIGARLFYVAFRWDYYSENLSEIVKIWEGGLAIYGGIIGGLLCAFIVCKVEKINYMNLLDMASMSLLIGQGIGRWGNYANQEAFGSFTNKSWGMMSDTVVSYIENNASYYGLDNVDDIPQYISDNNLFVHPTFFYESVWCLLGFVLLYVIMRKCRKFSGQLFYCYGIWYGLERLVVEGLRSDSLYIGSSSIRVSQLISAVLVAVCAFGLVFLLIRYTKHPKPIEGIDYFPPKSEKELAAEQKKKEQKELRKKAKDVVIRDGKIVYDKSKDKQRQTKDASAEEKNETVEMVEDDESGSEASENEEAEAENEISAEAAETNVPTDEEASSNESVEAENE